MFSEAEANTPFVGISSFTPLSIAALTISSVASIFRRTFFSSSEPVGEDANPSTISSTNSALPRGVSMLANFRPFKASDTWS
jgi:hypothetical protein